MDMALRIRAFYVIPQQRGATRRTVIFCHTFFGSNIPCGKYMALSAPS
jgi:hypothetical protein